MYMYISLDPEAAPGDLRVVWRDAEDEELATLPQLHIIYMFS